MIKIKRAYEAAEQADGMRILVDRLWPRGISKAKIKIDRWEKEIAPSDALRKWFGHEPERWTQFKRKYKAELKGQKKALQELRALGRKHTVTLLYGAKDELRNQAVVLREVLSR